MKRFQVENCVQNARQYAGEEPYEHISYNIVDGDVEAENEKEAIVNALYYLADNINDTNGMYAEVNLKDESILIYNDDDEVVEYYFDCVAKASPSPPSNNSTIAYFTIELAEYCKTRICLLISTGNSTNEMPLLTNVSTNDF